MIAKEIDPLGFNETTKQALEQAHQALDTYFDFLKGFVSASPSFGTDFGEKMKQQGVENITAFQELVRRLSNASSFEEALRVQTAFMHSQLNVLGKQTKSWTDAIANPAESADRKRDK
jgi:hypothetical protein